MIRLERKWHMNSGYGLSYTVLRSHTDSVEADEDQIKVSATVTNTGTADGKEVVEVYFSAPDGELDKPYQELAGYKKVEVEAGKSQKVEITFDTDDMASYDEKKEAYVMERAITRSVSETAQETMQKRQRFPWTQKL